MNCWVTLILTKIYCKKYKVRGTTGNFCVWLFSLTSSRMFNHSTYFFVGLLLLCRTFDATSFILQRIVIDVFQDLTSVLVHRDSLSDKSPLDIYVQLYMSSVVYIPSCTFLYSYLRFSWVKWVRRVSYPLFSNSHTDTIPHHD